MTNTNYPICYAVKNKNIDIVAQSRSGGAFTAFSDDVLEKGGVIYGCVFEGLKVLHIRAVSKEGRDRMRNSKQYRKCLPTSKKRLGCPKNSPFFRNPLSMSCY